jgi:predicted acylesterase/phospholipase RssA
LVLQGGGALGAYHIGAYQALEEAGFRPDWVSGISIGAINAAILVGNERSYVSVATNTSLSGTGSMRTIALYFQGNINHGRTACCCCLEGQAG